MVHLGVVLIENIDFVHEENQPYRFGAVFLEVLENPFHIADEIAIAVVGVFTFERAGFEVFEGRGQLLENVFGEGLEKLALRNAL